MTPPTGLRRKRDETLSIEFYDGKMKFLSRKSVSGITAFQYLGGRVADHNLQIFARESNTSKVFAIKMDPENSTVMSKESLFVAPEERMKYYQGTSANGNYQFVMTRNLTEGEKTYEYHGAVLDSKMQVVNRFNFFTDDIGKTILAATGFLTDEGILYIIHSREGSTKKSDYNPVEYQISQITKDGKHNQFPFSGLPQGSTKNLALVPSGNELRFVGTMSPPSTKGYTRFISGLLDPATRKVHDVKETDLTTFANIDGASEYSMKFIREKGISEDAELVKYFPLKNGGLRVLLENHNLWGSFMAYNPGIGPGSPYTSTSPHYFAKAAYVLQIDGQGKLEWIRVIAKYQEEIAHSFFIGTMYTMDNDENLHLFFHDNKYNEAIDGGLQIRMGLPGSSNVGMAAVTIRNNGSFTKQFMYEEDKLFIKFAIENSVEIAPGEIVFDHFFSRGKMPYRLGKIVVKN